MIILDLNKFIAPTLITSDHLRIDGSCLDGQCFMKPEKQVFRMYSFICVETVTHQYEIVADASETDYAIYGQVMQNIILVHLYISSICAHNR